MKSMTRLPEAASSPMPKAQPKNSATGISSSARSSAASGSAAA